MIFSFCRNARFALLIAALLALPAHAASVTFKATGAEQDFMVPPGMTSVKITASGGEGGATTSNGITRGKGGTTTATIAVTPGEVLAVFVGNAGGSSTGGFNGGGVGGAAGFASAGGGGGASDVRRGGISLSNRVVVAGGGGGTGSFFGGGVGGAGGGPVGAAGNDASGFPARGGGGGSQASGGTGGAGGSTGPDGLNGTLGVGGAGGVRGTLQNGCGGGGGGGYYGGGGGESGQDADFTGGAGGGGGSSFAIDTATNVTLDQGTRSGDGVVLFDIGPINNETALRTAILYANNGETITLEGDITLTQDLPSVSASVTIDGGGFKLDGAGQFRGFFVAAWTPGTATFGPVNATIQNITIQNATAKGGAGSDGAGGGAGLGGALFIANLATVIVKDVTLVNNNASGGANGSSGSGSGGGGGMGGNGGNANSTRGGGGGLGVGANGGNGGQSGAAGIASKAAAGGSGGGSAAGGANGGGGGGEGNGGDGGGGGVGGASGSLLSGDGSGGFGGGGGGGGEGNSIGAGSGGFGGGGGNGALRTSGAGGFGGGGGGSVQRSARGGFGGGAGSNDIYAGGGGAGMGGAIFVQQGGSLSIAGTLILNGNTVTPGIATNSGANGSAFGSGIFINGNNTISFGPASGETQTVGNVIADQTGNGGTAANAGACAVTKTGAGTLILAGANTFTGSTAVNSGTLLVNGSIAAQSATTVSAGATLGGTGTLYGSVTAQTGGRIAPGNSGIGTLSVGGSVTWNGSSDGSATAIFDLSNSDASSDKLAITGALTKGAGSTFKFDFQNTGSHGATYVLASFASTTFTASDFAAVNAGNSGAAQFAIVGTELQVIFNNPPTATVMLDNSSPKTNDVLTATATKSDPDNDPITLTFIWKVNGSVKKTTTATAATTDTFNLSIDGNGDRGDTITVDVIPNDGIVNGTAATASATVINTLPTATVTLDNSLPKTNDVLTATATKSDPDNDPITLTFIWKVNGSVKKTTTATAATTDTFNLSIAGNGDRGDTITVDVIPNDGIGNGTAATASATVVNSLPEVTSTASATPNPAGVAQQVNFSVAATDADGDTISYTWRFGDGASATGANVSHVYMTASTYEVTVTLNDGHGDPVVATIPVEVTGSTDIDLLHGTLKLNPGEDTAVLLAILNLAPNELNPLTNTITVQIGGLSRQFTVTGRGTFVADDAHLQFSTYKRQGVPLARILLTVRGSLKTALFAGLPLDGSGHPTTIPIQIQINSNLTGVYFPIAFRTIRKREFGTFGTK